MFQKSIKIARQYTYPVVILFHCEDGTTGSVIGTFIVLNEEGWILTAYHIVEELMKIHKEAHSYKKYEQKKHHIENDQSITEAKRKAKILQLKKPSENPITAYSTLWGRKGLHIDYFRFLPSADLAVGQFRDFDKNSISAYPVLKNPSIEMDIGKSLCKLGFPFQNIQPIFTESEGFRMPPEAFPIPLFPIEGIYTRTRKSHENPSIKIIETSSPGLMGQSGGPIFDSEGWIWAMQSKTAHYYLGFSPQVPNTQGRQLSHQFINCGIGTHVETIIGFLNQHSIKFNLSRD